MVRSIVALNIVVFALWMMPSESSVLFMVHNFLVSWDALMQGRVWVLLTSVFSHNMFFHIFLNMLVLVSFGITLERTLGSLRFLRFYLFAGIIASLAHSLISAWLLDRPELPALGASGAIAGVVMVFALLYPRERILLFGIIPIPALWGALAFVALDLWGLFAQAGGGGLPIGHGAHLGGALSGVLYYMIRLRPRLMNRGDWAPL